jgi:transcriptional regulator GlxA family with amidase domain
MPRATATRSETADQPPESGRLSRADRRDALLDAAVELVVSGDADAVSMEAVAERAGVSRPLDRRRATATTATLLAAIDPVLTQWRLRPTAEHALLLEEIYIGMVRGALGAAATA